MANEINNSAQEILDTIKQSKKVLLHCHPYPDLDSIGSVLAMTMALIKLGIEVTPIIGDSEYPSNLDSLPGHKMIQNKNYSEINPSMFDLFIILDSSSKSRVSELTDVNFPKSMRTIVIDHHKTNQKFGDLNFVDEISSSTCQILYALFTDWGIEIDKDMALYLFLGIFVDTGGFRYQNCSSETIRIASELTNIQPDYHKYIFNLENSRRPIELEMMGLALSSIEKHFFEKVVLSVIPYAEIKKRGLSKDGAIEGLVPDLLRSVRDWNLVASLVEVKPQEVLVSLRTRDEQTFDVSDIAKSVGEGGGGHRGAAGTTIHKPLLEAKALLLDYLAKAYPNIFDKPLF